MSLVGVLCKKEEQTASLKPLVPLLDFVLS